MSDLPSKVSIALGDCEHEWVPLVGHIERCTRCGRIEGHTATVSPLGVDVSLVNIRKTADDA